MPEIPQCVDFPPLVEVAPFLMAYFDMYLLSSCSSDRNVEFASLE